MNQYHTCLRTIHAVAGGDDLAATAKQVCFGRVLRVFLQNDEELMAPHFPHLLIHFTYNFEDTKDSTNRDTTVNVGRTIKRIKGDDVLAALVVVFNNERIFVLFRDKHAGFA